MVSLNEDRTPTAGHARSISVVRCGGLEKIGRLQALDCRKWTDKLIRKGFRELRGEADDFVGLIGPASGYKGRWASGPGASGLPLAKASWQTRWVGHNGGLFGGPWPTMVMGGRFPATFNGAIRWPHPTVSASRPSFRCGGRQSSAQWLEGQSPAIAP